MIILRKLLLVLIIGSLAFSCNSDDPSEIEKPKISKQISKYYSVINNDLKLIDSTVFLFENNKTVSFSGKTLRNGVELKVSSDISYLNGKISQLKRFTDNVLNYQEDFSYNNTGKLTQYQYKFWDREYERFDYYKAEYTYSNDTIYTSGYVRNDNTDYKLSNTSKTVLDNNSNKIYNEVTYNLDDSASTYIIESVFDEQSNLITCDLGSDVARTYTYSNIFNSESFAYFNSYGKETIMLISALECTPSAPLTLSNNMVTSTTVANTDSYNYEFDFESNDLNYTTKTTYKAVIDGEIREQISSEFIFE